MAKTAAERQAAYRAGRYKAGSDGNGEQRLNTWVSTEAHLAIERLANRYGLTQRGVIERLIRTRMTPCSPASRPTRPNGMPTSTASRPVTR